MAGLRRDAAGRGCPLRQRDGGADAVRPPGRRPRRPRPGRRRRRRRRQAPRDGKPRRTGGGERTGWRRVPIQGRRFCARDRAGLVPGSHGGCRRGLPVYAQAMGMGWAEPRAVRHPSRYIRVDISESMYPSRCVRVDMSELMCHIRVEMSESTYPRAGRSRKRPQCWAPGPAGMAAGAGGGGSAQRPRVGDAVHGPSPRVPATKADGECKPKSEEPHGERDL